MQKRACGGALAPQEGQVRSRGPPHSMQKRAEPGFLAPQRRQAMGSTGPPYDTGQVADELIQKTRPVAEA